MKVKKQKQLKNFQPKGTESNMFNYQHFDVVPHTAFLKPSIMPREGTQQEAKAFLDALVQRRQYLAKNKTELTRLDREAYQHEVELHFNIITNIMLHWYIEFLRASLNILHALPRSLHRSINSFHLEPPLTDRNVLSTPRDTRRRNKIKQTKFSHSI